MKKEKIVKILLKFFVAIIAFIGLYVFTDYIVFTIEKQKMIPELKATLKFKYFLKPSDVFMEYPPDGYFTDKENPSNSGRPPAGLEYKNKMPIVVFGCSFAEGLFLKKEQNFCYKLAHALKRPVYNRAIGGGSVQHMYLQVLSDKFYEEVPPADTIIYVFTQMQYRLLSGETWNVTDDFLYPYFEYENGKLKYADFKNPFLNFIRSSYLIRLIVQKYNKAHFFDDKNEEYLTDLFTEHVVETRETLANNPKYKEKHIKPKMVVLLYKNPKIEYKETLKRKLEAKGILVIDMSDIKGVQFNRTKYFVSYCHPSEKAWDVIVPFVVKKLQEKS
ncbi:MAG: hypothetical protein ACI37Z_04805 [Candidatus Gastranaerophilaceae bacterium]